jgi:hypothetical protein
MAEHYDNGSRITRFEYAPNANDFESGQLNPQLMNRLNYESDSNSESSDDEYEYAMKKEKYFKHLFSKPLKKIRFSVSSSDRVVSSYPKVEDCKILLNDSNNINEFTNAVGFNILSASVPRSYYNLNTSNKARVSGASVSGATDGFYTTIDLTAISNIDSYDDKTGKLTYGTATTTAGVTNLDKSIAKVLGLGINAGGTQYTSANPVMVDLRGTGFFDVEINNIPSIACIHSNHSKNIVSRIPITKDFGEIEEYKAQAPDISQNYFFPIKLTQLDIRILDEFGNLIGMNGVDYSLVCEMIVIGDLPDDI